MCRDGIIINYMKRKAASFIPKTRDESDQPNDDSRLYLASGTGRAPCKQTTSTTLSMIRKISAPCVGVKITVQKLLDAELCGLRPSPINSQGHVHRGCPLLIATQGLTESSLRTRDLSVTSSRIACNSSSVANTPVPDPRASAQLGSLSSRCFTDSLVMPGSIPTPH